MRRQKKRLQRRKSQQRNSTVCFVNQKNEEQENEMKNQQKVALTVLSAALLLSAATSSALEIKSGSDKVQLELYGEIDRAVMYADDGNQDKFFHVDNSNSETRVGLHGEAAATDCLTIGGNFELKWEANPGRLVSMDEESIAGEFSAELTEIYFEHSKAGKFSLGQGSMASDASSEIDLSGTDIVGNAGVADLGGGIIFYDAAAKEYASLTANDALAADAVFHGGISTEGLGKLNRVLYETPSFGGFTFGASAGEAEVVDFALSYSGEFGGNQLEAKAAWSNPGEGYTLINGSASLLFNSGLNFTVAAAAKEVDEMPENGDDPTFLYGKIGYKFDKLFSIGSTAVSIDYGVFDNDAVLDADQEATAVGVQFVQELEKYSTQLYAGYRVFSLEDNTSADYEDITVVVAGARFSF